MSADWAIGAAGLDMLDRLAAFLALYLRRGDTIALSGDLGAGKTTFARALIGHLAGPQAEIPSPTFALVQSYPEGRIPVTHVDCYRLATPDELDELGIDEALEEGAVVIEWPERAAGRLATDRLEVHLEDTGSQTERALTLTGHGSWGPRLDRLRAAVLFCVRAGWAGAVPSHLQGDASTRAYARLVVNNRKAILMDSPPMSDGPPVRDGKPYSQIAHLAEDVKPFIAIALALREAGFSAPEILAHETERGFVILEDLGDRLFGAEMDAGADPAELYRAAVDVLLALRRLPLPASLPLPGGGSHVLPSYDRGAFAIEVELLLDWFWPAATGKEAGEEARTSFLELWEPPFALLESEEPGWVLRDFHSPNLIWLPERSGVARVGLLDFQDAVRGPAAYDLVSLVQDARRDIPERLEGVLFEHYCAAFGGGERSFDRERFRTAYAILGAQRNTKILGIFARLARRDGKPGYLAHVPRVSAYLERNLAHPALAGLWAWYDRHLPARLRASACGA